MFVHQCTGHGFHRENCSQGVGSLVLFRQPGSGTKVTPPLLRAYA